MTPEGLVAVMERTLITALQIGGPIVLSALVVGLIVSIFQAATQINEMTLSFIPKAFGIFGALLFAGHWMVNLMLEYITRLYGSIPYVIG